MMIIVRRVLAVAVSALSVVLALAGPASAVPRALTDHGGTGYGFVTSTSPASPAQIAGSIVAAVAVSAVAIGAAMLAARRDRTQPVSVVEPAAAGDATCDDVACELPRRQGGAEERKAA